MPHLLHVWHNVSRRLDHAARTLLLFDYDGTLTPIVSTPDRAVLGEETRELLQELSLKEKFIVGIISGRALADVRDKVGLSGLTYAGNHGLEIQGPAVDFVHPQALAIRPALSRLGATLRDQLTPYPGVIVEDKGLTLSVHRRMVPDSTMKVRIDSLFKSIVESFPNASEVKVTQGSEVLEVRPNVAWDKGKAIAKLNDIYPDAAPTIFMGDDVTDEDGFQVVESLNGLAVFVGPARHPTRASYRVDSPDEVREALRLLARL